MDDEVLWLDQDWLRGIPLNASLSDAVRMAQVALSAWDHKRARAASSQLFEVFERWKAEKGNLAGAGDQPASRAEGPSAIRDGVPPWHCAGWDVVDPVDLLQRRLVRDEYQPFIDLSADWEDPQVTALALLCLHFATEWPYTPSAGGLLNGWCPGPNTDSSPPLLALKAGFQLVRLWLLRTYEDPPANRLAAAKAFVQVMGPDIRAGHQYRERQKSLGLSGAKARWAGRENEIVKGIISRLAQRKDELDDPEPPRDLWPHLFSALEEAGFRPDEASDDAITYGDHETLTFDAFRRRIQRARNT